MKSLFVTPVKSLMGISCKLPFRGGSFNNGANSGVFALNLNNPRTYSDNNRGFRSALLSWSDDDLSR